MQCAILQAINREADTDEAALERSEKHTFDPRRCGAGDCGQRGYDGMRPEGHALDGYSTWAAAALALVMLCSLYQFLRRIEAGEVFVSTNVAALRCISWCCAGAAGFCLLAAGIYLPFLFLAVAAGFMALIVRVLKNAFAQAVRMKDELDYTV